MQRGTARSPISWLAGLIVCYLAFPVVAFVVRFLRADNRGFSVPGLFPSLFVSLESATISLAIITVLGVPLAYLLARSRSRVASVVGLVVALPLALPPLMGGILLVYLVGPYTYLGQRFDGGLTMSLAGIVLAQTFVSAPFLIVAARAAFGEVDQGALDVAATLGHAETSRFARVALPMASSGIRAGMMLAWLRAFGEYGATVVLAYHPFSLPVFTYNQFSGAGLPTTLAPTALALVVAGVVGVVSRLHLTLHLPARRPRSVRPVPADPVGTPSTPAGFDLSHRLSAFTLAVAHPTSATRLAVLGPSGSGKSTLLRCVAGLYGPTPGPVWFGDRRVDHVRVERRRVGYVAQGFGLFPHLTVREHLLFAPDATPSLADHWLDRLQLQGLGGRLPSELSGGQRQRVGLAQALCRSPDVLLLDEPFSALDTPVRRELRRQLRILQRETGMATVLVTHDPEEAAELADHLIVLASGVALQSGPTRQLFTRPHSAEVARLLGVRNLYSGVIAEVGMVGTNGTQLRAETAGLEAGSPVLWTIRPEQVMVETAGALGGLRGTIVDVADLGLITELVVEVAPGLELVARTAGRAGLAEGQACSVSVDPEHIELWPVPSGRDALS